MSAWTKIIPEKEITEKITNETVKFAMEFGEHLGRDDKDGFKTIRQKLTTSQLRKFFGEVKRQQLHGYNETDFVLLKPKLAYAVGRATGNNPKIKDFYIVLSKAIDLVKNESHFKNFIKIFEAIVAYHKASEENKLN
jgi:CRISPR-associated protein Csm2